ncbi:LD-carboxypeptidase [Sphaerothrix gracilis]|uniref:S66 peptidase family protein n=1 Tax=Sphaerothrix gracilis TaxID=3151835 RepID=UPI0031FD4AA2
MQLAFCQPPPPLTPGDRLCVVAPSGALRELEKFQQGVDVWRSRGYEIELIPGYDAQWGYLAGSDGDRRQQLYKALQDPDCKGILCARGGYGGTRLLEDWQWPDVNKWLVGFSDVTSLLWSLSQRGIAGIHGPLLTTLADEPDGSVQRLFNWIEGRGIGPLHGNGWGGGSAEGKLMPANLTVATCLLGTSAEPALDNVILAFEDVSEAPYRIDRMLTHWRMMGRLQAVRGIALGRFSQCEAKKLPSFNVTEVLRDRLGDLGLPIVSDLPFGHDGVNAALPVGVPARIDGDQGVLTILPAA